VLLNLNQPEVEGGSLADQSKLSKWSLKWLHGFSSNM